MINKLPIKSFLAIAGCVFLNNNAGAMVIIEDNFDATTPIGPALQLLSNSVGGAGVFSTSGINDGQITTSTGTNNTTGFNTSSLVTLSPDVDSITATFVVDSASVGPASANGFFLGIVTGDDATNTGGSGLFNNTTLSFGLQILNGGANAENRILQDGGVGDPEETLFTPNITVSDASINDGFTFTLTLRDDDTFDATTTGLSTEISTSGTLSAAGGPIFADFADGVGLNSTLQTNGTPGFVTFDSVSLSAIPEPSSALLLAGGLGCLAFRRKRQK